MVSYVIPYHDTSYTAPASYSDTSDTWSNNWPAVNLLWADSPPPSWQTLREWAFWERLATAHRWFREVGPKALMSWPRKVQLRLKMMFAHSGYLPWRLRAKLKSK